MSSHWHSTHRLIGTRYTNQYSIYKTSTASSHESISTPTEQVATLPTHQQSNNSNNHSFNTATRPTISASTQSHANNSNNLIALASTQQHANNSNNHSFNTATRPTISASTQLHANNSNNHWSNTAACTPNTQHAVLIIPDMLGCKRFPLIVFVTFITDGQPQELENVGYVSNLL